jgi:hypothetical protein
VTKTCLKCRSELPLDRFGTERRNSDGLNRWCRECVKSVNAAYRRQHPERARAATKAWRERNPDKTRAHSRASKLRLYGLAAVDYLALLERQAGRCAVCRDRAGKRALHVDHRHVAGYEAMSPEERRQHVRGLLCANCNRGLGHAGMTPFCWRRQQPTWMLSKRVRTPSARSAGRGDRRPALPPAGARNCASNPRVALDSPPRSSHASERGSSYSFGLQGVIFREGWKSTNNDFHYFIPRHKIHLYSEKAVILVAEKMRQDPEYVSRARESCRHHLRKKSKR